MPCGSTGEAVSRHTRTHVRRHDDKDKIYDLEEWADCARLRWRADRKMIIILRGGTAAFQIETGRWHGVASEEEYVKNAEVARERTWNIGCSLMRHGRPTEKHCLC